MEHRSGPPAEVEHRAVVGGTHPLVTGRAQGLVQLPADDVRIGSCHAEPREERLGVADGGDLRGVGDDRHLREHVEPRAVVLVGVGEDDEPDVRVRATARPTSRDGSTRTVPSVPLTSRELAAG